MWVLLFFQCKGRFLLGEDWKIITICLMWCCKDLPSDNLAPLVNGLWVWKLPEVCKWGKRIWHFNSLNLNHSPFVSSDGIDCAPPMLCPYVVSVDTLFFVSIAFWRLSISPIFPCPSHFDLTAHYVDWAHLFLKVKCYPQKAQSCNKAPTVSLSLQRTATTGLFKDTGAPSH